MENAFAPRRDGGRPSGAPLEHSTTLTYRGIQWVSGRSMVQVTVNLDKETYKKLDQERKRTGLPMSQIIQLYIRGLEIRSRQ